MEEFDLINKIKQGDDSAFELLVSKYSNYIFRLAFSIIKDEEDAKELTQEVFIKIYLSIKNFNGKASLSTWIYRITYNLCLDYLKKHKKRRTLTRSLDDDEVPEITSLRSREETPQEAVERAETKRDIMEGLETLPEEQRALIELKDIRGFSYEEIIAITGLKEGTLKSRLFRGRLALKNYLTQKWNLTKQTQSKNMNNNGKEEDR